MTPDILKKLQALEPNMATMSLAAVAIAASAGSVSVDDIRSTLTIPGDLKILGAVVAQLGRTGVLQKIGYQSSKQKSAGKRPIFSYALADDWRGNWIHKMPEKYPCPRWLLDLKPVMTVTPETDGFEHLKVLLEALRHYQDLHPDNQLPPAMWEKVASAKSYTENLERARANIAAGSKP